LLPEDQSDRVNIVLVSPRNPLNIGAVARAMANFGFSRLTVVAPFAPHWREAKSAIGAPDLLQSAIETATLPEAVSTASLVIGTGTVTTRKPEQPLLALPNLAPIVRDQLNRSGQISIVFGPEKHGLTRDDLSYCHLFVEIPTHPRQPSMNLGQAVAVCLYELATRLTPSELAPDTSNPHPQSPTSSSTTSGDLDLLAGIIEQTMIAAEYSPPSMKAANAHDIRLLLRRLSPARKDTRRILGLFRRVLWHLAHDKQQD
jgi:TrmH family RNA methyltransferase